jgi:hypothetical protein
VICTQGSIYQRRLFSTAPTQPPITLMSRRLLLQYEKEMRHAAKGKAPKKKAVKDDTPWPRNVVYGAYAVMAIFIPYTAAWFLSTNERLRSLVLPDDDNDSLRPLVEYMRHHFGVPDWQCLSEPETLVVHTIPHKFVDEPTARIRQQQAWIQRFEQGTVQVKITCRDQEEDTNALFPSTNEDSFHASHVLELPAKTLARPEEIAKVVPATVSLRPPLALDFLDSDYDEEAVKNESLSLQSVTEESPDRTPFVPNLSIYSLWHFQAPTLAATSEPSSSKDLKNMSPLAIELSRLNYEIDRLQAELQQASSSHRSIDDIQAELASLKSAKRRLQWRKLWSRS